MTVYRGIVRGNTIELTEPVDLPEGAEVEVRPLVSLTREEEERAREDAFQQHLLAEGIISFIPPRTPPPGWEDWEPVEIEGPPLSQQIIEERR